MDEIWKNLNLNNLDGETWKTIEEYPDYQISNFGRIKSFKKTNVRILKQQSDRNDHLQFRFCKNNKYYAKYIHDLVYETFYNDKLKSNECAHHKDKNPKNNYYENLKKMSKFDHKSLHNKGELNNNSKLKNEEVWLIKKILNSDYYKSGKITQKFIGKMFKVNQTIISKIKLGQLWSYIIYKDDNK